MCTSTPPLPPLWLQLTLPFALPLHHDVPVQRSGHGVGKLGALQERGHRAAGFSRAAGDPLCHWLPDLGPGLPTGGRSTETHTGPGREPVYAARVTCPGRPPLGWATALPRYARTARGSLTQRPRLFLTAPGASPSLPVLSALTEASGAPLLYRHIRRLGRILPGSRRQPALRVGRKRKAETRSTGTGESKPAADRRAQRPEGPRPCNSGRASLVRGARD